MSPRSAIAAFSATLFAFVALDVAWLTFYSIGQFQREIGGLLRAQPYFGAVGAFYLIYAAALTALAVQPAAANESLPGAVWRGALFGLAAYATYDLTNFATLKGWPLSLALIDLAWGTFASALASLAGYLVASRLR